MNLYRALEFNKLQYLLTEDQYLFWINKDLGYSKKNYMNWWLEKNSSTGIARKKVISTVASNPGETFFDKSAEYNSIFGGRFNPAKSFGGIYCSNSPFIASLEVLYHFMMDSISTLKPISKNKSAVQTILNNRFGNQVEVIIVVYEFQLERKGSFYELNDCLPSLKSLCESIGFQRYISESFDRNFIFGNDYEISRVLGCHIHSRKENGFKVPSARIDFLNQDSLRKRNYFFPEKEIDSIKPKLTGRYREFRYVFDIEQNDDGYYPVKMETDNNGQKVKKTFFLEPIPNKKSFSKKQIISYEHNVSLDAPKNLREVHTQKFISKYEID